jgi:hypothetical protein
MKEQTRWVSEVTVRLMSDGELARLAAAAALLEQS